MTDQQFQQLMAVQIATLAALEGIGNSLAVLTATQGKASGHNWNRVRDFMKQAEAIRDGK
jgi:hypothetical protein